MFWFWFWFIGSTLTAASFVAVTYLREMLDLKFNNENVEDFMVFLVSDFLNDLDDSDGLMRLSIASLLWPITVSILSAIGLAFLIVIPLFQRLFKNVATMDDDTENN